MQTADMDDWRWWRQVLVRGSGFPASGVLRLADEGLARKADSPGERRPGIAGVAAFREEFGAATVQMAAEMQAIAAQDDFLRAVTWQNHRLTDGATALSCGGIRPRTQALQAPAGGRTDRQLLAAVLRQERHDRLLRAFRVGQAGRRRADPVRAGERMLRSTEVFFEAWAIDRLAKAIEEIPGMHEWLMPRRLSFIKLDGDALVEPAGRRVTLPRSMRACCARVTERRELTTSQSAQISTCLMVLEILQVLQERHWISWKLELPVSPWPERDLRRFLDGVGDEKARHQALERLDALEGARDQLRDSASAGTLAGALTSLDELFERVTGAASDASRRAHCAARTLVYHDSSRDIDIVLGDDLVAATRPLKLLSRAARWYCSRLGEEARDTLRDVHAGRSLSTASRSTFPRSGSRRCARCTGRLKRR